MYTVVYTKQFAKSFKKLIKKSKYGLLQEELEECVVSLAQGKKLALGYRDNKLQGEWGRAREFHLRGDVLVIYEIRESILVLTLLDIGSHSQLFR